VVGMAEMGRGSSTVGVVVCRLDAKNKPWIASWFTAMFVISREEEARACAVAHTHVPAAQPALGAPLGMRVLVCVPLLLCILPSDVSLWQFCSVLPNHISGRIYTSAATLASSSACY